MKKSLGVFAWLFIGVSMLFAQLTPDQQAEMILSSARKAYAEKNFPVAVTRFREFADRFPMHKENNSARFWLALSQLALPMKDRNEAEIVGTLQRLAADVKFEERPAAAFQYALMLRNLGLREIANVQGGPQGTPQEIQQRELTLKQRLDQAAVAYAAALPLLQGEAKAPGEKDLGEPWELVARVRCDWAEMLLRQGKLKETLAAAEPFLADANLTRSRYKDFGRYLYAHAAFLMGDMPTAQKTLTMLAPFASPEYGPHARYLLARTFHLAEERGDALANYEGVLADQQKHLTNAALMLKEPQRFNNDPVKRAEFEEFLKRPAPDHLARATLYLGVLLYEAGRFAEAKTRFQEFVKTFPQQPLKLDAEVRIGFCQVQLKEYAEAIKTLQPLTDKDAVADQANFWIGKAQLALCPDPATKWNEYRAQAGNAINSMRIASDRTSKLPDSPEVRARRGEIALEVADIFHSIKEPKSAADVYNAILVNKFLPEREEELTLRLIQALHQLGDYNESDKRCKTFFESYPKSSLLAPAAFTYAENAIFRAAAYEKSTAPSPDRNKQLSAHYDEAFKRLESVVREHPDFSKIPLVRYTIGLTHYRQGDFDKAFKAWNDIPSSDRVGDLALASYLMADCVLRRTPAVLPDDADGIATGKVEEQLRTASDLLEAFVAGNPKHADTPDALLKLGLCQQRRAGMVVDPMDKQAFLGGARATYERLVKEFPASPSTPTAVFERAKVLFILGDGNGAINELRRFQQDPLKSARVAPLAMINLATILRAQNNPVAAADLLQKTRELYEVPLGADPTRASWVASLRFHQAVALREAGKLPESRAVFQAVVGAAPKTPEGVEAALRAGQSMKEEGMLRVEAGRKMLANPKEAPNAAPAIADGFRLIREGAQFLEQATDQFKDMTTANETRARMLYDAAWGWRLASEVDAREAKQALLRELNAKVGPKGVKTLVFDVPLKQVPLQKSESKARDLYKRMVEQFSDVPLAIDARLELAELLSQREEFDPALALLTEALDREPNVDVMEKIRLRLGAVHAAKGNIKGALTQFETVAHNLKSQNLPWAHYRIAETMLQNKDYAGAIKRLIPFRDDAPFTQVPGLTDRALLRLGQAYAFNNDPGLSAQAYQKLLTVFPNSPWVDEARFGLGWAMQKQGSLEEAGGHYKAVVDRTAAEIATRAILQIGLIRMEQKRHHEAALAFLIVPNTYGFSEQSAVALLHAADAFREAGLRDQMVGTLQRVMNEYPNSDFANEAKQRLEKKQ
ncbi:MAG: tetratricopeptide repeat protein [Planctomycetota bacterium]